VSPYGIERTTIVARHRAEPSLLDARSWSKDGASWASCRISGGSTARSPDRDEAAGPLRAPPIAPRRASWYPCHLPAPRLTTANRNRPLRSPIFPKSLALGRRCTVADASSRYSGIRCTAPADGERRFGAAPGRHRRRVQPTMSGGRWRMPAVAGGLRVSWPRYEQYLLLHKSNAPPTLLHPLRPSISPSFLPATSPASTHALQRDASTRTAWIPLPRLMGEVGAGSCCGISVRRQ
jgi:hypothetical protein